MERIETVRALVWWIKQNADLDAAITIELTSFENEGEGFTSILTTTDKTGELIQCELLNNVVMV